MITLWIVELFCSLLGAPIGQTSAATQPAVPLASTSSINSTQEVQHGILIVRHGFAPPARVTPAAAAVVPGLTPEEMILVELADLGLIHIRPRITDAGPSWKYRPKQYSAYHAKPNWSYQPDAGWHYDAQSGWRLCPEPAWSLRPGAVDALLTQLPTAGDNWRVTRWE